MSCKYCAQENQNIENPASHDFRIIGDGLYFHDSTLGWEGVKANYCFDCGRELSKSKE